MLWFYVEIFDLILLLPFHHSGSRAEVKDTNLFFVEKICGVVLWLILFPLLNY